MQHLKPIPIRKNKIADYKVQSKNRIPTLKKDCYCVVKGYSILGEAPKSFIRVYEYEKGGKQRKVNRKSWALYIAKTGHKWYPLESITEHLIARIGATLGLNMAKSRLVEAGGQIKFLSKYFLRNDLGQELVHGMDIIVASLGGDRNFVEEIANQKREREFFTLEETVQAIRELFPTEQNTILESFFLMLCFDAWVGVQDRHFQNWGIIRNIYENHKPYFSPIYDSARGLFWNTQENKISEWVRYKQLELQIQNQINNSLPQMGLEGKSRINHFDLAEILLSDRFIPIKSKAQQIFTDKNMKSVQAMICSEFKGLLSENRMLLILKCLSTRHNHFCRLLI